MPTMSAPAASALSPNSGTPLEVFTAFLRLGLTSFGGPVAHIGYFRQDLVERRRWLDEHAYLDLVALCQFLPGPTSSQVGIGIGLTRAGYLGALAAWLGFTLPSAILMVLFALGIARFGTVAGSGWLHGLMVAAVAAVGVFALPGDRPRSQSALAAGVGRAVATAAIAAFFVLLVGLPLLAALFPSQALKEINAFYRAGSLVFGGGHVVLPLLQAAVVPPGWVTDDAFLAGYGAAQAVPGPLFTFAAYLGAAMGLEPNGILGAALCLVAIFLPSFLLVIGILPFWQVLRTKPRAQAALDGVNAAVVGLLLAALYRPVWLSAIGSPRDFALALAAFLLLTAWKTPPWLVVVLCAAGGAVLARFP
jgi:chromate transporter